MNGSRALGFPATLAGSLLLAVAGPTPAQESIESLSKKVADLEAKLPKGGASGTSSLGSMFKLYGFLRVDAMYDSSRPNSTQLPVWIRSEDPLAPAGVAAKRNEQDFNMHPKLTRVGLDFDGGKIGGMGDPAITGRLETDFYNATATESREALRIRVAYLQLKWNDCTLYGGQMWDLISPLMPIVNPDMVSWGAGNLGDRRPQVRGEWSKTSGDHKFTVAGMAGATGAIDAQDADANGYRDGDQSAHPTLQTRIGWKSSLFDIGAWAHRAKERTDVPVGGEQHFKSSAYGVDFQIPLKGEQLWLKGELWNGRNLFDVRGGILQDFSPTGDEIRSEGGFLEVGWKANDRMKLHGGWSFDNPENEDLGGTSNIKSRNTIAYAAATFDFKPVAFGIHFLHWTTGYKGFDEGDDNRVQAYLQYSF
jgi:hypothetical protein